MSLVLCFENDVTNSRVHLVDVFLLSYVNDALFFDLILSMQLIICSLINEKTGV